MLRKYSVSFFALVLLLASSVMVFAQTAPVRGKVELKKADNTVVPVEGAVIEVYRTDIKAKLPSGKTDKKGFFVFAGMPLGATMTFAVSGKGIKAEMIPGIKAGNEDVKITVYEGDGKALTEEEVRSALSTGPKQAQGGEETPEAKKAREEYEKQLAEAKAKNEKIEKANEIVKRAGEEGAKAYNEKNYDLAIAKFDEGINADPEFTPNVVLFSNNKALSYRNRGFEAYKQSISDAANKASWLEKAKNDFQGSLAASSKSLEMIGKVTDQAELAKYAKNKYDALDNLVEVRRLAIRTNSDPSQINEIGPALEAYLAVETDAAKKTKYQIGVGDAYRLSGNTAMAIPIYQKVLEAEPNNYDVMGYLGLCLFAEGAAKPDQAEGKQQMQEGLNYMQKFTESATDKPGDKDYAEFKQSVAEAVKYLKEQNLKPQALPKTTPAKGKKP
jgi:tetratricopeptide (TPR) repeat protein